MNNTQRERKTSRYALVIHEVTSSTAKVWVGALLPSLAKPKNWRLRVRKADNGFQSETDLGDVVQTIEHLAAQGDVWQRLFKNLHKRFYAVEIITGLLAGQDYVIEFEARVRHAWHLLETAFLTTLPERLPASPNAPFTVGIGSCFYTKHDGGQAGRAYEALFKSQQFKPDIKFLVGDQVYADIGLGLYPLDKEDCQERIADDYAESWELLRSLLRRGGTWMLADDHEYWNNYPYLKGFNPYLITLDLDGGFRKHWEAAAKMGVKAVQQMQPIRTFNIGTDLSFCVADLRSERSDQGFISEAEFFKIIAWIKGLQSPGVLVIPQPFIAEKGSVNDSNLPDWPQYAQLLQVMQAGNHDVVVLAGDVHYGRVSQVRIGHSNNQLVEVITSPMSNLSELNGFAAAVPNLKKKNFPIVDVNGVEKQKIKYLGKVSTESKWWDLRFPKRRTTEHFMTLDFYRENGKVAMKIHAWNARKIVRRTGLPERIKRFNIAPIYLD